MDNGNIAIARRYLQAIENREDSIAFYAPDVLQEEFPNLLLPNGARRGLAELADASERGQKVMIKERFEVRNAIASGDHVALEVLWTGTLAIPFGSIPIGGQMRAHFGVFLEFRDGKIVAQRNYDCFDPW